MTASASTFPRNLRLAHEGVHRMNHNKTDFAYQLVYRYLLRLINEVNSGPAVRLPSLRSLARRLRVSISTVQNACQLITREGRAHLLRAQVRLLRAAQPLSRHPLRGR
jgi:DNA-binding transcriptional MocR family regulator